MWKRYFTKGKIYGVDINPDAKQYGESRISIEIGDQADEDFFEMVSAKAEGFDIIIDDGAHYDAYQLKTFYHFFNLVNEGGVYII